MIFPSKKDQVEKVTFEIYQSQTRSIELGGSMSSSGPIDSAMVPNDIVRSDMYEKNKKSRKGPTLVFEQKNFFFTPPPFFGKSYKLPALD